MNPDDPLSPMIAGNFSSITKELGVEVPSHAQRILRKLSEMRNNTNLCDTELCCQGDSYLVHRSVLAGGSEYFANYFDRWVTNPPQKKVLLKSVESSALSVILDFLYSGVLNITTNNMFDIFVAADKLQVEEARYVCITKLHVHLNHESCVETLNFAQLYSLPALSEAAITLICTEPIVYTGDSKLTTESWDEIRGWLARNKSVVNPYIACSNVLQIQPGCESALREVLCGIIDSKTDELLNMKILPTAFSILNAARANVETSGEASTSRDITSSPRDTEHPEPSPFSVSKLTLPLRAVVSVGQDTSATSPSDTVVTVQQPPTGNSTRALETEQTELIPVSTDPPGVSESSNQRDDNTEADKPPHTIATTSETPGPSTVDTDLALPRGCSVDVATKPLPVKYPNSRLWTIACNHHEIVDDCLNRISKKRRIEPQSTLYSNPVPKWAIKIMLLGGCNSTMSTVRTIFRHIQPFSVVTGVTVVSDNLALNVRPEFKDDDEWEECGSLSQLCYGCAATTIGTKAYVFGGKGHNSQYLATFQEFDMVHNTSKLLPSAKHPKENAVAVRIGADIYIVGGRNNTVQHGQYLVDKYNVKSGKWESIAPCFKIGYLGAAAACNGLLYTFCGQRPHGKATDTVMCYEPHSDSWSPQPNAPSTMNACQATTHHRKIFLLTTEYKNFILYQFQPDQKLWSKVNKCEPYLNDPQSFFIMNSAIVSHEGYLYVLLFMCEEVLRVIRVQKFNITTGEWQIVSTKPVPVQNSGVVMMSFCQTERKKVVERAVRLDK